MHLDALIKIVWKQDRKSVCIKRFYNLKVDVSIHCSRI